MFQPASPDTLNNESAEVSEDDEFLDDESGSNDHLKLKMIRRGNKIFRVRTNRRTPVCQITNNE